MTDIDTVAEPKALLHDHLDGGLRVSTIIELADHIGWQLPVDDAAELQRWFTAGAESGDLLQYLATFEHTLAVMQRPDFVERVAYEAVIDLARDGVVYAEIRFAPELHTSGDMRLDDVVEAVTSGFRRGERQAADDGIAITVNAICCAMRTESRSMEVAELVARHQRTDDKVVGFDLAGAETGFPPSMHAEALQFAREHHLNVTIHASEPPDLELIDDALVHGAHRIGHGVRLQADIDIEDGQITRLGELARYVLDHQVHLEMAPTCHVHVGAVPDLRSHPIGPMLRAGFNVGINTDNRLMSDVMPSSELDAVTETFALSADEVRRLATNAIAASFAPYETRRSLIDSLGQARS